MTYKAVQERRMKATMKVRDRIVALLIEQGDPKRRQEALALATKQEEAKRRMSLPRH